MVTPASLGPVAAAPSQIVVVCPASEDGKEVEAKQGQAKLALFNIGAMLDFEANAISNIQYGINSASMDDIYADQRSARPGMITDLMNTAFIQARKQDATSIFSTQATLHFIGKSFGSHLLNGNFEINRVSRLGNDHTNLNLTSFLPQRDVALIQTAQTAERRV